MPNSHSVIKAFEARDDLKAYGDDALLLFALALKRNIEDVHAVASQYLTGGSDDKKCDLVYVDRDGQYALVAQGYLAKGAKKVVAPANKASDLNTAVAWLLSQEIDTLPDRIKAAAIELRDALQAGVIKTIEFWYVHNLIESKNVSDELTSVEASAKNAIQVRYPNSGCDQIKAIEVGLDTLQEWYRAIRTTILVDEEFELEIPGGYTLVSNEWEAFTTAIPAEWLYDRYKKHGTQLFSANVRDYLGSRKSDSNINNGIKQSATRSPDNFWAFNNGITALVYDFALALDKKSITLKGLAIVNGAQTTGAIGSLENRPDKSVLIPARFIKCPKAKIVKDIIRYNNSQNKIAPADFRSYDNVQDRLRKEFQKFYPAIPYSGGRRGGSDDFIKRPQNLIPSDTAAQSLAAFHQRPVVAYNQKGDIWESDQEYSRVFNDSTHADHIIFTYSLNRAISNIKLLLLAKEKANTPLTSDERETLGFLRYRGSVYLLMAAMGACMETFLDKPVANTFLLRFRDQPGVSEAEILWQPIVQSGLSLNAALKSPLEKGLGLKNETEVEGAIKSFKSLVGATRIVNSRIYNEFANKVVTAPWLTTSVKSRTSASPHKGRKA